MRKTWKEFWKKFKDPPVWVQVVTYVLAVFSSIGSLLILFTDWQGNALEIVAYALFGIAGCSLGYAVYLIVRFAPRVKENVIDFLEKREFTCALLRNYGFRTVIFAIGSFVMSVLFGVYNGALGIIGGSIWFGALAAYYIMLACIRGGVLMRHKKKRGLAADRFQESKTYRNCGILLLFLNVALSSAIAQMIFSDQHFSYADWTIFASAAYAFFKITMSIINIFKARKQDEITVKMIRQVNLVDATVSILALQTALLWTFDTGEMNISTANTLTGSVVSVFAVGLSVYMIYKGHKDMKEILREKNNGKQGV